MQATDVELLLVHCSIQDCLTVCKQIRWIEWFVLDEILETIWLWRKINLSLLKILLAECLQIIYSLTSHVYNYLTMCRRIIGFGLNCWCCIAAMLGAISFVCRQVGSGSFGILSTKYSFVNLWFNMHINEVWHCVACRGFYAIKATKPNQTWEHFEASKKPHPFTEIWQNQPFHQYLAK